MIKLSLQLFKFCLQILDVFFAIIAGDLGSDSIFLFLKLFLLLSGEISVICQLIGVSLLLFSSLFPDDFFLLIRVFLKLWAFVGVADLADYI